MAVYFCENRDKNINRLTDLTDEDKSMIEFRDNFLMKMIKILKMFPPVFS